MRWSEFLTVTWELYIAPASRGVISFLILHRCVGVGVLGIRCTGCKCTKCRRLGCRCAGCRCPGCRYIGYTHPALGLAVGLTFAHLRTLLVGSLVQLVGREVNAFFQLMEGREKNVS